jgi:hypothetical protein
MTGRVRRLLVAAALTLASSMFGCAGAVPAPAQTAPRCGHPFEYIWDSETGDASATEVVPACENVIVEAGEDRIVWVVDGRTVLARMPRADAIAFRDAQGVGYVSVSRSRPPTLHLPWRDATVALGPPPRARQWGIADVVAGPDGWWVWSFGTSVLDDPSPATTIIDLVFVSRSSLEVERVDWPDFLQPSRHHITPVLGGLDVIVESGSRLSLRLRIQRREGCQPSHPSVVSQAPRCRTRQAIPPCFGYC